MATNELVEKCFNALGDYENVLNDEGWNYCERVNLAIECLELGLNSLAKMGLLSKVSVRIDAITEGNKLHTRKYALASRCDREGEEATYIKCTMIEEDE